VTKAVGQEKVKTGIIGVLPACKDVHHWCAACASFVHHSCAACRCPLSLAAAVYSSLDVVPCGGEAGREYDVQSDKTYETEASCDGGRASVRQRFLRLRHQFAAARKCPTLQRVLACGCGAV